MRPGQVVLRNLISLGVADAVCKALGLVTVTYLARRLDPAGFGIINFSISFVNYFAFAVDPGLSMIGTRQIAQAPGRAADTVAQIWSLKAVLSMAAFLLTVLVSAILPQPGDVKAMVVLYGLLLFAQVPAPGWVFQGFQRMEFAAAFSILQALLYTGGILLIVKQPLHIARVPLILAASGVLAALAVFPAVRALMGRVMLSFPRADTIALLRTSVPVGISAFLVFGVNWNISTTLLGLWSPLSVVGHFSAAFKLALIIMGIAVAVEISVFPAMARYWISSREALDRLMRMLEKALMLAGIPFILGGIMMAGPVLEAVFGTKYLLSTRSLQFLIPGAVLYAFNIMYFALMIASGRQRDNLKVCVVRTAATVGISMAIVLLRPNAGMVAAAYLLGELIGFVLYQRRLSGMYCSTVAAHLLRPAAAAAVMGLVLWMLRGGNAFVNIGAGTAVYAVCLSLFGGIRREEIMRFRELMAGR